MTYTGPQFFGGTLKKPLQMTGERVWLLKNIKEAGAAMKPKRVLQVGHDHQYDPDYGTEDVVSVDPHEKGATYVQKYEDLPPGYWDMIDMTATLDYLQDPVLCLRRAARECDALLVQGRLYTYKSPTFCIKYWGLTKEAVEDLLPRLVLPLKVHWTKYYNEQMFSVLFERR